MGSAVGNMNDIVYILKNGIDPEELRYSVRSVVKNFPYRKIWFYGGLPEGIRPDKMVRVEQTGETKWEKVAGTLRMVCENDEITEDFWLFNDDFFIMKKTEDFPVAVRGTLKDRVEGIAHKHGYLTKYGLQLKATEEILKENGFGTLDYTLHVPILVNRKIAIECLGAFPGCPMFRSLYGNYAEIGGIAMQDVKITAPEAAPTGEEQMLSTSDRSWKDGKVGEYIREQFKEPCKYERA